MARVLILTPSYSPRLGGVERHVSQIGQGLLAKGWKVTVLTRQFANLAEHEMERKIRVLRFSFPNIRFIGLFVIWWKLITRFWREVRAADIVHIHDVFIWYLPLRFFCWRTPIVTTFHGWEGKYPVPWKNVLIRKIAAALSARTVAVGKYLEKYYRFKADAVIYGAVEMPARVPRKEKLLLYVGRLEYDTGLPVLLQALARGAWRGKVIFCGDGLLREQAEQLGTVTGFVDPGPYFQKAKVVFGGGYLSIVEAFASRCAVVAAEKNPLKKDYYLLSPFAPWLQLVSTPEELARQLNRLSRPSTQQRTVTAHAYQWAKTQTWQSISDLYIRLYLQVAKLSAE